MLFYTAMGKLAERFNREKPWAALGISRREYETARPWKKAEMERKAFEELVCLLPPGAIEELRLEADAEKLLDGVFKAAEEEGNG